MKNFSFTTCIIKLEYNDLLEYLLFLEITIMHFFVQQSICLNNYNTFFVKYIMFIYYY